MNDRLKQNVSRRRMVAGAGTAGVLAAAAAVIPAGRQPAEGAKAAPAAPSEEGGYRLSEHVLRYYQTTRV